MCYSASNKYNIDCLVNYVLENYSGQRKTVSSSATSDSSSRNLTSSYQSSNDDSIGDVIGNVVAARTSSVKLTTIPIAVRAHSIGELACFNPVAQPTSKMAATMTNIHIVVQTPTLFYN